MEMRHSQVASRQQASRRCPAFSSHRCGGLRGATCRARAQSPAVVINQAAGEHASASGLPSSLPPLDGACDGSRTAPQARRRLTRKPPLRGAGSYESNVAFTEFGNWLIPGHLMLGRYPFVEPSRCLTREQGEAQLRTILEQEISTFVSLQVRCRMLANG
jgi:hypothetical protein